MNISASPEIPPDVGVLAGWMPVTLTAELVSRARAGGLPCARRRQLVCTRLELAQHVEGPWARPFIAPAAETIPHPLDGARIEELALESGRTQFWLSLPHPSRHRKGEPHLGAIPDGARNPTIRRIEEERLGTLRIELEAGRQREHVRHEAVVEIGDAHLDGVGHAHHVPIPQELVTEIVRDIEPRESLTHPAVGLLGRWEGRRVRLVRREPQKPLHLARIEEPPN